LATALYELKLFAAALDQYEWLLKTKPDLVVAHYFIATAHDYLGEYEQALASYESFLSSADEKTNQLEIEKVKLRLPLLRRQIQLKQGVKQNPRVLHRINEPYKPTMKLAGIQQPMIRGTQVILFLVAIGVLTATGQVPHPDDQTAPPPLKVITRAERSQINESKDPKERIKTNS